MNEQENPRYTFTYQPTKRDIKYAAAVLNNRRRWTDNRVQFITQGALFFFAVVFLALIAAFVGREGWTRILTASTIVLLLQTALEILVCFRNVYWPDCIRYYMRDRAADADRPQTYSFYDDRVEIEEPSGRLTHAYTAYDRLVLTPDLFFLLIFEFRGEHLPWSVLPAEQREGFRAFLLDRAAAHNVPVEDRAAKKSRRNSK